MLTTPRYSTYVNLMDTLSAGGASNNVAEADFIYGGSFEAPIMGNTRINLCNGRIFNSFAGSCNADILGHTETYVGSGLLKDGTAIEGFPYIIDHIYGGNDLGGSILGENVPNSIRRHRMQCKHWQTATSPTV